MCAILQLMHVLSNNLHVLPGQHLLSRQFPLILRMIQINVVEPSPLPTNALGFSCVKTLP